MKSSYWNTCRTLSYSAVIFILFFILLEIAARAYLIAHHYNSGESLRYALTHIQEPVKFRKIEPGDADDSYHIGMPSANRKNPVNSRGFRGPEVALNKTKPVRIVCIGSSTTYGDGLLYHETYPAILQAYLNDRFGDDQYEVINAGQSGLLLKQIIPLTRNEVLPLNPDIYLFMNINNNLDARGYWFIDVHGTAIRRTDGTGERMFTALKKAGDFLISKTAFGHCINSFFTPGLTQYFLNFDWAGFAHKAIEPDNVWEGPYRKNIQAFVEMVLSHSADATIIFLEEPVNTAGYPAMDLPFELAKSILRDASRSYENVYSLDVQTPILEAAARGEAVWQSPSYDPLHLSGHGNTVLAQVVADFIKQCCAGRPVQ